MCQNETNEHLAYVLSIIKDKICAVLSFIIDKITLYLSFIKDKRMEKNVCTSRGRKRNYCCSDLEVDIGVKRKIVPINLYRKTILRFNSIRILSILPLPQ